MDDKELLVEALKTWFGPQLKGKYIVEFRGSVTIDADNKGDAITKAKEMVVNDPGKVVYMATKVEDLVR